MKTKREARKEEPKKCASWRRGYQAGVKSERERMRKEIEVRIK